jgi:hypothetical protein
MALSRRLLPLLLVVLCHPLAAATLTGRVTSEGGGVPSEVFVTIHDHTGARIVGRTPVLLGRVNVRFPDDVSVIQCLFEAAGYGPRRVNLDVVKGVANAGEVRMRRLPGLVVGKPSFSLSADRKEEWVDVVVSNESKEDVIVETVELTATRKRDTDCLDLTTPNIVIALTSLGVKPAVTITAGAATESKVPETAQVRFGKCEQAHVDLRTKLTYRTAGEEKHRLRLVVPHTVVVGGAAKTLDLDKWRLVSVRLIAQDGRVFRSP